MASCPLPDEDCGSLAGSDCRRVYQQLGEVVEGLRALSGVIEIRHDQVEKLHDLVRDDFDLLRKEQSELEEKLDCALYIFQHDLEELRSGATCSATSVDALTVAVQELRRLVEDLVALRSRIAGAIFGIGLFGGIIVWLCEPFYKWVIESGLHYLTAFRH